MSKERMSVSLRKLLSETCRKIDPSNREVIEERIRMAREIASNGQVTITHFRQAESSKTQVPKSTKHNS